MGVDAAVNARVENIQALRAVAALLVVTVHLYGVEATYLLGPPWLAALHLSGSYGVDLFFVISGAVMTMTTWRDFGKAGAPRAFLARRATRILPPYWIVLAVMLAALWLVPSAINPHAGVRPDVVRSFLLLPQRGEPLLVVGWTLTYEAVFYLVFASALRFRRALLVAVCAAWLATIVTIALRAPADDPVARVLGSPFNLEFLFGIAAGALVMTRRLQVPWAFLGAGTAAMVAAFVATAHAGGDYLSPSWWRPFTVGIPAALIVYGAVVLDVRDGRRAPKALQRLGDASYSLYLWHVPAIGALALAMHRFHLQGPAAHALVVAGGYALSVAVALIAFAVIERPMLGWFRRRGSAAAAAW